MRDIIGTLHRIDYLPLLTRTEIVGSNVIAAGRFVPAAEGVTHTIDVGTTIPPNAIVVATVVGSGDDGIISAMVTAVVGQLVTVLTSVPIGSSYTIHYAIFQP